MKLRQKLAAVLAATMVVTAVPVTTMAASTNRITKSLTVAKDSKIGFDTVDSTTTAGTIEVTNDNAPRLVIDLDDNMAANEVFFVKITDGEFADVNEYKYAGLQNDSRFEITRISKTELQVKTNEAIAHGAADLEIPVYAKATGAETTVEIVAENSAVSGGKFVVARTNEAKGIVSTEEATTFYTEGTVANITIEEAFAGAFAAADTADKKITLTIDNDDFKFVSGKATLGRGFNTQTINLTADANDDQVITIDLSGLNLTGNARGSVVVSDLKVKSTTKNPDLGDFNITVGGELVNEKAHKVANVADYGVSLKMKDDKVVEVVAGQEKEIEFTLKENVDDSINSGRFVEIRLDNDMYFTTSTAIKMGTTTITSDKYITEKIDDVERVVGFEVELTANPDKRDEYKFTGKVSVPVNFTGDIKVTAEGRAIGEELEVVAMTAKAPVEVETEAAVLKVGLKEQEAGKVVITETEKAMLKKGEKLVFTLADEEGITFTGKPEVKVTAGDLVLGDVELDSKNNQLTVEVKRASKEASTIELTNFEVKLDRTVPQGKYDLEIGGKALAANGTELKVENFFIVGTPNTEDITNGMRKGTASFVNGATTYTVNGETKEMDGAAFISKAGRMMLPVRYVSEAFGIEGNNVIFADGTVTILAGTRTLQLKNGSDIAVLNGAQIKMAEKVVIKDGRTYVPVGEVGRLLGVSVSFDDATKTATFENK